MGVPTAILGHERAFSNGRFEVACSQVSQDLVDPTPKGPIRVPNAALGHPSGDTK